MGRSARPPRRTPALALVLLLACGRAPTSAPARAPEPARNRAAPSPSRFTRLPDASTVALLLTANNVDLAYARIAAARALHREVKALARRETTGHATLNADLNQLIASLDLTPREDEVSRVLRDQSSTRRDSLRALSGRRFDSAYVANEVRYHQELLLAIDRVFLPSVRRSDLREYVTSLRPTISAHLEHAEQVQATIAAARR